MAGVNPVSESNTQFNLPEPEVLVVQFPHSVCQCSSRQCHCFSRHQNQMKFGSDWRPLEIGMLPMSIAVSVPTILNSPPVSKLTRWEEWFIAPSFLHPFNTLMAMYCGISGVADSFRQDEGNEDWNLECFWSPWVLWVLQGIWSIQDILQEFHRHWGQNKLCYTCEFCQENDCYQPFQFETIELTKPSSGQLIEWKQNYDSSSYENVVPQLNLNQLIQPF